MGFAFEAYLEKEWIAKTKNGSALSKFAQVGWGWGCLGRLALMRSDCYLKLGVRVFFFSYRSTVWNNSNGGTPSF